MAEHGITKWQKGVILFGCAEGYPRKEVAKFVNVSTFIFVINYRQWQNPQNMNDFHQNCKQKVLRNRGHHSLFHFGNKNRLDSRIAFLPNVNSSQRNPV